MIAMSKDRNLAEQIAWEHAGIRNAVRDIRAEIERLPGDPGRAAKLCGMLRMFGHHLARHFELEEQGGLLGDSSGLDPGTHRVIEGLLAQHRALERQLVALIDDAERAEVGGASLSDAFVRKLRDFLARLYLHEQTENDLVQKLVFRDLGGGD